MFPAAPPGPPAAMPLALDVPDPRHWPQSPATPAARALHDDIQTRLSVPSVDAAERIDDAVDARLCEWLRNGDGAALGRAVASAPSPAVARHLVRRLAVAEAAALRGPALAAVLFALPVVIVAAGTDAGARLTLPAVLDDPAALGALLRAQRMPLASADFALAPALAGAAALEPATLPRWVAHARGMLAGDAPGALDVAPAPLHVEGTQEQAHLRFVVGTAVAGPAADPFAAEAGPGWAMAAARALSAGLAAPGATVLALPRAPLRVAAALPAGRAAQREIALQLFVASALRELRSRYGEPVAVISAHEAADAPGGGELRLSLSSPFEARSAHGFRFALAPTERVEDGVAAIAALLADCRVADVRTVARVETDRDALTGLPRFCRPDDEPVH